MLTHGWIAAFDRQKCLENWNGYAPLCTSFQAKWTFCTVPPFHVCISALNEICGSHTVQAFGLSASLFTPLLSKSKACIIWPPIGRLVNTTTVDEVIDSTTIDILVVAPSILEELVQLPALLAKMNKVQSVITGGGNNGNNLHFPTS